MPKRQRAPVRRNLRLPAFARRRPLTTLILGVLVAVDLVATGNVLFFQGGGGPPSATPALTGAALVRAVQVELGARGFYDERADGRAGRKTQAAIRQFQRAVGLRETGRVTPEILEGIRGSTVARAEAGPNPALVSTVQRLLADLGYAPGPINGLVGAETKTAIETFERDRGLPVTGKVQDTLIRELNAVSG